jgi:tRNA A-37 threonylcarbamoyl transferase component Bud32
VPVGPSRHLVRFIEVDGRMWALKELPLRTAQREYANLRELEERSLPAVRPAGIVVQPFEDTAILATRYLDGSWQYRRLLMRLPSPMRKHRERLFDAMAALLVDLHRSGVYWGDCSLANTLFKRDGQVLQAWLVDAETSAVHPSLTDGQRAMDLDILEENVAGGLLDVAARLNEPPEVFDQLIEEVEGVRRRYCDLWDVLHDEPTVRLGDRHEIAARLRRLNDLGFAVEEVRMVGDSPDSETLRLQFVVAERGFHAEELRKRTGLVVGEGQATILLNDLRAYHGYLQQLQQEPVPEEAAAQRWLENVFRPGMARAHAAVGRVGDPIQAYCDLLEVRWLLSERAGHDVGNEPALEALARRAVPTESAAELAVADAAADTAELAVLSSERMQALSPPDPGSAGYIDAWGDEP